ncbi:MAG: glycosyltransferase [Oligoflexia bacterium]|nr:glycosyltransferase [Oligoflexia bacterium]
MNMQHGQPDFIGNIDRAVTWSSSSGSSYLRVEGWLVSPHSEIIELLFTEPSGRKTRADLFIREDLALKLPHISHAASGGFRFDAALPGAADEMIQLHFEALLKNGQRLFSSFEVVPGTGLLYSPALDLEFGSTLDRSKLFKLFGEQLQDFISSDRRLSFDPAPEPELSVVSVLYNRAELTLAFLKSLREELRGQNSEVILIDNASSDQTSELLTRISGVQVMRNPQNFHFIHGSNQGAALARGRYLLFVNNDTVLLPGAIAAALQRIKNDRSTGVVGGRLIHPDGRLQEAGSVVLGDGAAHAIGRGDNPAAPDYLCSRQVDFCSGAFFLTERELFQTLGGFDHAYEPAYFEDVDFCFKARERGRKTIFEPQCAIIHCEMASATSDQAAQALMLKNRAVFMARHEPALKERLLSKRIRQLRNPSTLLIIDDFIPRADRGQGAPRAALLMACALSEGFEVSLLATNEPAGSTRADFPGLPSGIRQVEFYRRSEMERFFKEGERQFDVFIVSRPHNMQSFRTVWQDAGLVSPKSAVIYDAEAIFARRTLLQREIIEGRSFSVDERATVESLEMDVARGVDAVLCVSDSERKAFEAYGYPSTHVLSHGVSIRGEGPPFAGRSGFLMVGPTLESEAPNTDAVRWFVQEVLPQIAVLQRDAPTLFSLAGECRVESLRAMQTSNFNLLGQVQALERLYDTQRVFVAPMRYSAGIPLKVIEAAANGLPVVATPLVAHQLGWQDGEELLVGQSAEDFAVKCRVLHHNHETWQRIRTAALSRVRREYSEQAFRAAFHQILVALQLR